MSCKTTIAIQECSLHANALTLPQFLTCFAHGNMASCMRPVSSGMPIMRLRFCMACPEAPFTRLSMTANAPQAWCSAPQHNSDGHSAPECMLWQVERLEALRAHT